MKQILLLCAVLAGCGRSTADEGAKPAAAPAAGKAEVVDGATARKLVKEGAVLVDVRTPEEYAAGHVEGAVNIPVQEIDRRWKEIGATDRPVVLYCRSGNRSARAGKILAQAGFQKVYDFGAMSNW